VTINSNTLPDRYFHAIHAFNDGNLELFGELFADDCVFNTSTGLLGSSRAEIVRNIGRARDAGWTSHDPIGAFAAGEFLAIAFQNSYSDGSAIVEAAVLRFDERGQVTEVQSLQPR